MTNRRVKYQLLMSRDASTIHEAPLWAFIFELGYFNAMNCGLIPPGECLNSFFNSGRSAEASWEPFEITPGEYAELESKLLKPDLDALSQYSRNGWQSFSRDASLDGYTDYAQWQLKVREKHQQAWAMGMAKLQHEMAMTPR